MDRRQFVQQEAEEALEGLLGSDGLDDYEFLEGGEFDTATPLLDFDIMIDLDGPCDKDALYNQTDASIGSLGNFLNTSVADSNSEVSSITNSNTLGSQNDNQNAEQGDPG